MAAVYNQFNANVRFLLGCGKPGMLGAGVCQQSTLEGMHALALDWADETCLVAGWMHAIQQDVLPMLHRPRWPRQQECTCQQWTAMLF
jgi:hypothetical protein